MDQLLKDFEQKIKSIIDSLRQEFLNIRTNRPTAKLVEDIKVNYLDQQFLVKQLGSISVAPPKEIDISSQHVRVAMDRIVNLILESVLATIETTPPELLADIYERGIVLTGGGALIQRLDQRISAEINIPVHVSDDPLTAVARGTGIILEDLEHLRSIVMPSTATTLN